MTVTSVHTATTKCELLFALFLISPPPRPPSSPCDTHTLLGNESFPFILHDTCKYFILSHLLCKLIWQHNGDTGSGARGQREKWKNSFTLTSSFSHSMNRFHSFTLHANKMSSPAWWQFSGHKKQSKSLGQRERVKSFCLRQKYDFHLKHFELVFDFLCISCVSLSLFLSLCFGVWSFCFTFIRSRLCK